MLGRLGRLLAGRLGEEHGMALVMAVGVAATLAITGGSLVLYSTSNEGTANRSRADQRAYNLAQSGIDSAVSQIAARSPNITFVPNRTSANLFVGLAKTQTFDTGESVTWDGALDLPTSSLFQNYRWRLTATATVPNPTSGGTAITRTVTADVVLSPKVDPVNTSVAWKYILSKDDVAAATCDVFLPNNPSFQASFYVNGTLCLANSSEIVGPGPGDPDVDVVAKQGIWVQHPAAWIGRSRNVTSVQTGAMPRRCRYRTAGWDQVCNNAVHVNANVVTTFAVAVPSPSANFSGVAAVASPSNLLPCRVASGAYPNFASGSTFQLDGGNYTCQNPFVVDSAGAHPPGELSYNATTRVLTVKGLVYFPGNLETVSGQTIEYRGTGAIYVGGTYYQRQTKLCAKRTVSLADCDWANWDTSANVLLIATAGSGTGGNWDPQCLNKAADGGDNSASGIQLDQSSWFQGALYADGNTNICLQNFSEFQGPAVAHSVVFGNSVKYHPMPAGGLVRVPFGMPGIPVTEYEVTPPTNYRG